MFKNAYFGKVYKTREGLKAIYLRYCELSKHHELITENLEDIEVDDRGLHFDDSEYLDIVSEWKEEINEYKLYKLAEKVFPDTYEFGEYERIAYKVSRMVEREAFKVGYRKAIENGRS